MHLSEHQCRRCGKVHDEVGQMVDHAGRWAITTVECECGHCWTVIHTAPTNWKALRVWIAQGCEPEEGPLSVTHSIPWADCRLEGVRPALMAAAS